MQPFILCPVHANPDSAIHVAEVESGHAVIMGRVSTVRAFFSNIGAEPEDTPWMLIRPELEPDNPSQLMACRVITPAEWTPRFTPFGDGGFVVPEFAVIERSPSGEVCVHIPGTDRHTYISPAPLASQN